MNNKGQSLILFVLVIPVVFLILVMVYDIGCMITLREKLDGINYLAIDYGLTKIENDNLEDEIKKVILKNKSDIDNIKIDIDSGKISIMLEDSIDSKIYLGNSKIFHVRSYYIGYINEENERIIERNK